MGLFLKVGLLLTFFIIAVLLVSAIAFYLRPLALIVWSRRIALFCTGMQKTELATQVGKQMVWQGGAGPLLVLLHGAGDQAGTWNKVVPELKRRFRLLIPDLAGHGQSEPPAGSLSIGTVLTALEEVLEAPLWRDASMVLVGNSLGAWLAMLYAQKHADRVSRVVLIDGGPIQNATQIGLMPKNRAEARRVMETVLDPSSPRPSNFFLDDLIRVSNSGAISRLMAAGVEDMSKYLLDGQLASFPVAVDLIWGASDRLVPVDYARRLQSQLPDCRLEVIDRCGHAPQLERPRELTGVLLKLLSCVSQNAPSTTSSVAVPSGKHP